MQKACSNQYFLSCFGIFICAIVLISGAAYAECPLHKPITTVNFETNPVEYIREHDASELSYMHSGEHYAGLHVLGLTGGGISVRFSASFQALPYADLENHYCLNVKSVNATFSASPKIYIAKNFSRGTCEYAKVLEHELEHVKILKNAHTEFLQEYRNYLYLAASQIPVLTPMLLSDINLYKQQLITYISNDLNGYLQETEREIEIRQEALDSNEEYRRVLEKCEKWDKRLEK